MKSRRIRTMNKRRRNKRERAEWAAAGRLVRLWLDEAATVIAAPGKPWFRLEAHRGGAE